MKEYRYFNKITSLFSRYRAETESAAYEQLKKDIKEEGLDGIMFWELLSDNMKVKIKKLHKDAVIPTYSKNGDAGMDLVAVSKSKDAGGIATYGTGLSIEIPEGYVGLIFPRSSIHKFELSLANSIGVVDSGYRGEIILKFRNTDWTEENNSTYDEGDRIGQLMILPYPQIEFEEVEELSETERGVGGFGSTGN